MSGAGERPDGSSVSANHRGALGGLWPLGVQDREHGSGVRCDPLGGAQGLRQHGLVPIEVSLEHDAQGEQGGTRPLVPSDQVKEHARIGEVKVHELWADFVSQGGDATATLAI